VRELQQELHAGDVTTDQLQVQVQALDQQATAQAAIMERIERRIMHEAKQLEKVRGCLAVWLFGCLAVWLLRELLIPTSLAITATFSDVAMTGHSSP